MGLPICVFTGGTGTSLAMKPHWGEVINKTHDIQLGSAPTGLGRMERILGNNVATSPLLLEGKKEKVDRQWKVKNDVREPLVLLKGARDVYMSGTNSARLVDGSDQNPKRWVLRLFGRLPPTPPTPCPGSREK